MADTGYFPQIPDVKPVIYAYEYCGGETYDGYIKIGFTAHNAENRIKALDKYDDSDFEIVGTWSAMRNDGSIITDKDVCNYLLAEGIKQSETEEEDCMWFGCKAEDIGKAVEALKENTDYTREEGAPALRPEQEIAVKRAARYFQTTKNNPPRFLWNTKINFGKVFCAYVLCRTMKTRNVLILTFSSAPDPDWQDMLRKHRVFENWQFISEDTARNNNMTLDEAFINADKENPVIVCGSLHDLFETNGHGGIKAKNAFIHDTQWDLIIFDDYRYGSWRENEAELLENAEEKDFDPEKYKLEEADNTYKEGFMPVKETNYLYICSTPFYALNTGDFERDQIYNWTYFDEQKAKDEWPHLSSFPTYRPEHYDINPYKTLPRMVLLTFRTPEDILKITDQKVSDEVDFDKFFCADGEKEKAVFRYEKNVQKWLDFIRGAYTQSAAGESRAVLRKPHVPYGDRRILGAMFHSLWLLPDEAACYAMKNLLEKQQNEFFHDYKVLLCAGSPESSDNIESIKQAMGNPLETRTITLTCGRLTTGTALSPWSGILMLRNIKSPETYFNAAFRIQKPWVMYDEFNERYILKQECYIFDFSPARALRQIADYSSQFNVFENSPDKRVTRFANSLPVLEYDGTGTSRLNTADIISQIPAPQVAKRWKSAMLVNVDNNTLRRLSEDDKAIEALMENEGFSNIRKNIKSILTAYEDVRNARTKEEDLTEEERQEMEQSEEEYKHKRRMIQKKLIRFTTHIPLFLYLSGGQKYSLDDIMNLSDSEFFRTVTGFDAESFRLLTSLNVFNESLLHDAVYKFGQYEEKNLDYTGITRLYNEPTGTRITYASEEDNISTDTVTMTAAEVAAMIASLKTPTRKRKQYAPRKKKRTKEEIVADYTNKYGGLAAAGAAVPQEAKTEIPLPKIKVGMKVSHRKYGYGRIVDIDPDQKYFYVSFPLGDKKFQYPNAITLHFVDIIE